MPGMIVSEDDAAMDTAILESQQQKQYPGLSVRREGVSIVVHIPVRFRRRIGRQMILMPNQQAGEMPEAISTDTKRGARDETNQPLVMALAKAYAWQEQLESGKYACVEELARANRVDRTYVSRMLRLTSLAPDIVEAILRGDEPNGLSLRKLKNDLPVRWDEQRTLRW